MNPARHTVQAAAAAAALACIGFAAAHAAPAPDITGVWMVQHPYQLGVPLSPAPQLTPAAKGAVERMNAARQAGYVRSVGNMLCEGGGGPELSQMRSPFEIFSGFGRMTMVFETESFNQPRTFYLDEKTQPDDIFPSMNGHSIAHWEGAALVVDTVGFNGRGTEPGHLPRSEKAHLTERFTVSPDGQTLTDQLTVEDPLVLAAPWSIALKYDRKPPTEERMEVVCDVDLEALKRVDLQALKGADPEVARLLDPEQNGSDPALRIPAAAPKP